MARFKNWTDYHQRINLIFHAIVAVTMLPFVWLYLEIDSGNKAGINDDPIIIWLFVLICFSLVSTALVFRRRQLKESKLKGTLREKLESYMRLQVISFAMLEGAALFSTLGFYLSAHYVFVVIYIAVLFVFSLGRPQLERTCRDLSLKKEDRNILADRMEIA